jgi:hypothetical protein
VAGLDPDLLLRSSGLQYARSEGAHVAYRVITGKRGGVSDVVLMLCGTASMEAFFEDAVVCGCLVGSPILGGWWSLTDAGLGCLTLGLIPRTRASSAGAATSKRSLQLLA